MAPRKRKNEESAKATEVTAAVTQSSTRRVTRSLTRGASSANPVESRSAVRAKKKAKVAQKKEQKKEEDDPEEKAEESEKKAEAENEKGQEKAEEEDDGEATKKAGDESNKRTFVIEHCKQCNSFKTRANQVKAGLEEGVSGITVLINPDKPRRGCFEIREEGGEMFISLLDMKRPFKPMKELNMEEVINDIVEKIK